MSIKFPLINLGKCVDLIFPTLNNTPEAPCFNYTQTECRVRVLRQFFATDVISNCSAECPDECSSITYLTRLSFHDYPFDYYAEHLVNSSSYLKSIVANVTGSDRYRLIKENVLSMIIYYEQTSYGSLIESPKMEYTDLISNIGGTLVIH